MLMVNVEFCLNRIHFIMLISIQERISVKHYHVIHAGSSIILIANFLNGWGDSSKVCSVVPEDASLKVLPSCLCSNSTMRHWGPPVAGE
ncbi:hypothetical protein CR157_17515 [Halomonas sp. LBP4]|nr:hypothetical protein CR157_17515 [Halomonas sp. LBP4]